METSMIVTICVALITAVVGPTILEIVKNRLKKSEEDEDPMYKEMEADIVVNEQLKVLLDDIGCDRIWISQFHNGGHYYSSGVSIKKFSIFYEVVSPGISIIQQQFQNVPTSFFSRALKEIHDHGDLIIHDMHDAETTSYGLRDTAKDTGCRSVFLACLKTPSGKFHGVLAVEFVKEPHTFTEEQKEEIRSAASFISGTLSLIHKTK